VSVNQKWPAVAAVQAPGKSGCGRDSDVEFLCARFQYYRYFR